MKNVISLGLALIVGVSSWTNAQEQVLKFNKDKKFKIVQFTDVHFQPENPKSDIALERMNEVLDAEKPDLVIFTGDAIYAKPGLEAMRKVLEPTVSHKIPFAVTFGNHDDEQGASRAELYDLLKTIPYNLTASENGLSGVTNYILPVKSADGTNDAAALYCMDSHSYSSVKGIGGYDFIKRDQIDWYSKKSAAYKAKNGDTPLPALAFFHIPVPEYNEASASEGAIFMGIRKEKACSPELNSGLFTAMKQAGDVMGIFVGHDHDNDYAVYWKGILLCYGRYTGGDTVYNNLSNGARVIELTQGERAFKTWIHLKDNEIQQVSNYPSDFIKKKD